MNWIVFSLLMFVFSNALYLLIRKAQIEKVETSVYSIPLFFIPAIFYFILALFTRTPLIISFPQFFLIIVAALFWSYLGNYFSQKGILYAPNPGYSLTLQKSYVILTTVAAFFLFASELSFTKVIGVLIIIGFSALISISKGKKEAQIKWVMFSLGAHLCFAFGSLISKHFLNIGLKPYTYLFYITAIVSVLNYLESRVKKTNFSLSKYQCFVMLGIGISATFFNLFMQLGYKYSPNPGYVASVNTSSVMSLTLLSAALFKDSLSMKKLIGILGVLVGLIIILIL